MLARRGGAAPTPRAHGAGSERVESHRSLRASKRQSNDGGIEVDDASGSGGVAVQGKTPRRSSLASATPRRHSVRQAHALDGVDMSKELTPAKSAAIAMFASMAMRG